MPPWAKTHTKIDLDLQGVRTWTGQSNSCLRERKTDISDFWNIFSYTLKKEAVSISFLGSLSFLLINKHGLNFNILVNN